MKVGDKYTLINPDEHTEGVWVVADIDKDDVVTSHREDEPKLLLITSRERLETEWMPY